MITILLNFISGESLFGNVLVRNTEIKKLTKNIQNFETNLRLKMKKTII